MELLSVSVAPQRLSQLSRSYFSFPFSPPIGVKGMGLGVNPQVQSKGYIIYSYMTGPGKLQ